MTNSIALVLIVSTQWFTLPGNHKTEGGTNYVLQVPIVSTNLVIQEVTLCTNPTLYRAYPGRTNGPAIWRPIAGPPPLPTIYSPSRQ